MTSDNGKLIIRKASAGSGKTFTLVKEYLKLAFSGSEQAIDMRFSHILAITFTNKAANEMKTRILKYLDEIVAMGYDSDMGRGISEEMHLEMEVLQDYAKRVKKSILHHYSDLAVYTIDSFMHRIVRTFAHDLNLPMNFDVMIEQDELIETAVDELMSLAGTEGEGALTKILSAYAENEMEEGKSYDVRNRIIKLAGELFKEGSVEQIDKLKHLSFEDFGHIMQEYYRKNKEVEQRLKAKGLEGMTLIEDNHIQIEDFYRGKTGIGGYLKSIALGQKFEKGNSYVMDFVEKGKIASSKADHHVTEAIEMIKPQLCQIYEAIETILDEEMRGYNTRSLMMQNLYSMAVLNKLNDIVQSDARSNEMIHISEFNKQIAKVVQDEPAPFIYERVGNRYYNFLIDEFQDTSKQQWMNLVPLLDNGVGNGHTSLIVGDGKQAIYRFRNGDVSQFMNLPHVDSELHGQNFEHLSDIDHLKDNYRSCENIVEFNNRLYRWISESIHSENVDLREIYTSAEQSPKKSGGYVEVGFYSDKELGIKTSIGKEIMHQIELGYHYSDITILARDNRTLSEIGVYLSEQGIPLVSNESFLLGNSLVVRLIGAMLHYLLDNCDRVAAMKVLLLLKDLGIIEYKQDYSLDLLKSNRVVDLDAILGREGITIDSDLLRSMTLYDCCETLIKTLHLEKLDRAYVTTLLNKISVYENRHRQDLAEFLDYLDEKIDKISTQTSSDKDAVQLMTIHKAKGLESRVVMYAIPSRRDMSDRMWVDVGDDKLPTAMVSVRKDYESDFEMQMDAEQMKKEIDDINVLYVATTRPKEKLVIYCDEPPKNPTTQSYEVILQQFIVEDSDAMWISKEDDDGRILHIGENEKRGEDKEKDSDFELIELNSISYPEWISRIRIADQADEIFAPEKGEQIRRGLMVHEVLSAVKDYGDVIVAVEQYASKNEMDETTKNELKCSVEEMVQDERVRMFFDKGNKVLNEHELLYEGKVLRPDRIVFHDDEVWVIDFKTGSPDSSHHLQVKRYCSAVRSMGYRNVVGYLIYMGGKDIAVEVV